MKQTRQAVHAIKQSILFRCQCETQIGFLWPKVAKASIATVIVKSVFALNFESVNSTYKMQQACQMFDDNAKDSRLFHIHFFFFMDG
jgi:hypothetical protein